MSDSLLSHEPLETSTGSVPAINTENKIYLKAIFFGGYRKITSAEPGGRAVYRGSAAARLWGLRVRILPGAWMSISCECCQAGVSATDRSLIQRSPTECACVSVSSGTTINSAPTTSRWKEVKTKRGRKEGRKKDYCL